MNQVNNPNQVPDHRMSEISEQLRRMREENQQLRNTLNQVYQRQMTPPPTGKKESPFDPKVDQALQERLNDIIQERFEPKLKQAENAIGALADRNDALEFQIKWGKEAVEKYGPKIEELKKAQEQNGRWISREEAYKHIFFEETARKPQPKPEGPKPPQFDPYLNRFVGQEAPQLVEADAQLPGQQQIPGQPQQPGQFPGQQQFQQMPQAQYPVQNAGQYPQQPWQQQPQQNPGIPNLPPMTDQRPVSNLPNANPSGMGLDLTSDEAALASWEKKFGDSPI